jgi:hypothetical protein
MAGHGGSMRDERAWEGLECGAVPGNPHPRIAATTRVAGIDMTVGAIVMDQAYGAGAGPPGDLLPYQVMATGGSRVLEMFHGEPSRPV